MKEEKTFAEKYPRLNILLGLVIIILGLIIVVLFLKWVLGLIENGIISFTDFVKNFVSTTDKVIVVALITGAVSIVGVVISSIVVKVVDYRYKVKKDLYDKREEPYRKFIEMIYRVMEDTKAVNGKKLTEKETIKMISEFSKDLTLWGSNRVVKKWLNYRKKAVKGDNPEELLWDLEDIIYEIRKDVGVRRRLKKGDMLAFFINDIENLKKNNT